MKLKITIKDLEAKDACQSGIDEFVKQFGKVTNLDWTRESQIELLKKPMRKYIGWAYWVGLIPLWSMSGANLTGADLTGANLSEADLSKANDLTGVFIAADPKISGWKFENGRLWRI